MNSSNKPIIKFYDLLGEKYDWFSTFEGQAKTAAFNWLALSPGDKLLNIGIGSGKDHTRIHLAIQPGGKSYGIDLSTGMINAARKKGFIELVQADAMQLPFACNYFDRIYCAYLLELLPQASLADTLVEFSNRLVSGGRMVLLSLTEGIDLTSKLFTTVWNQVYKISATACGGCRPLDLIGNVQKTGLRIIHYETIVQLGIPSQLVVVQL